MTRSRTFLSFILGSTMMTACAGITPEDAGGSDPVELAGTTGSSSEETAETVTEKAAWSPGDVFEGPYGGVPAFDKMDIALIEPALEKGMDAAQAEIDDITANPDAPTFENTIAAMEDSARELERALVYYYLWGSNLSTPEFREIETRMDPEIQAFYDSINQNQALFSRVDAVRTGDEYETLTPAQQRLTEIIH